MANTRNQEFLHLQYEFKKHEVCIQIMSSQIHFNNYRLDTFRAKVIGELIEVKGEFSSLTQWLKQTLGSPSLE